MYDWSVVRTKDMKNWEDFGAVMSVRETFPWARDDKARTLTIGAREGAYDGMLTNRSFTVVLPDGASRRVAYTGEEVKVRF